MEKTERLTVEQWTAINMDEQIPAGYESLGKLEDIMGEYFMKEHDLNYRLWVWKNQDDLMVSADFGNSHCGIVAYMYDDKITTIEEPDEEMMNALIKAFSFIRQQFVEKKSESKMENKTTVIYSHKIEYWYLGEEFQDKELSESSKEHIIHLLSKDFIEGELCEYDIDTDTEYSGWWKIVR